MKKGVLIAAMSVSGLFSASVGNGVSFLTDIENKNSEERPKVAKSDTNSLPAQDCVPVTFHGCIHATTCISDFSFEKADEWIEKIEENYCNN